MQRRKPPLEAICRVINAGGGVFGAVQAIRLGFYYTDALEDGVRGGTVVMVYGVKVIYDASRYTIEPIMEDA